LSLRHAAAAVRDQGDRPGPKKPSSVAKATSI
jgi:hypothetical protein